MEELINKLGKALCDEEKGVDEYTEMAEEFKERGHDNYAQILFDMADEESIHAKHLREIMAEVAKL